MEIAFWQGFLVLYALASLFVIWPVIVVRKNCKKALRTAAHTQISDDLYSEQVRELESTHASGEINAAELGALRKDLEQTHSAELAATGFDTDKPIVSSFRSRLPVLGLLLVFPVFGFLIYSHVGAKPDWDIYQSVMHRAHSAEDSEREQVNEALIDQLQKRLASEPGNVQNWYLLASVALESGDYDEAVRAFKRILSIEPTAATVIGELAQALFLQAGNTITPEVREYTDQALMLAPELPTALGLAGIDAFQSGEYQRAIDNWQRAVEQLNPQSSASKVLAEGISRAKAALKQSGASVADDSKNTKEVDLIAVKVSVSLDKALVNVPPDASVFVYARAWQGAKMPLAIQKLTVADLPVKVTLDDSMAMAPGMSLSSFPQVEIVARISLSGSAIPQSGDWVASAGPIILAEHGGVVKLNISEQVK